MYNKDPGLHNFVLENSSLFTDINPSNKYNITKLEYTTNIHNQLVFFVHKFRLFKICSILDS